MIKDPERFLGRRNFAAVMQITDDFHDFLMSESPNDFEDIGVIGFDPDTKQVQNDQKLAKNSYFWPFLIFF